MCNVYVCMYMCMYVTSQLWEGDLTVPWGQHDSVNSFYSVIKQIARTMLHK